MDGDGRNSGVNRIQLEVMMFTLQVMLHAGTLNRLALGLQNGMFDSENSSAAYAVLWAAHRAGIPNCNEPIRMVQSGSLRWRVVLSLFRGSLMVTVE